jgi:hypothetical protein
MRAAPLLAALLTLRLAGGEDQQTPASAVTATAAAAQGGLPGGRGVTSPGLDLHLPPHGRSGAAPHALASAESQAALSALEGMHVPSSSTGTWDEDGDGVVHGGEVARLRDAWAALAARETAAGNGAHAAALAANLTSARLSARKLYTDWAHATDAAMVRKDYVAIIEMTKRVMPSPFLRLLTFNAENNMDFRLTVALASAGHQYTLRALGELEKLSAKYHGDEGRTAQLRHILRDTMRKQVNALWAEHDVDRDDSLGSEELRGLSAAIAPETHGFSGGASRSLSSLLSLLWWSGKCEWLHGWEHAAAVHRRPPYAERVRCH